MFDVHPQDRCFTWTNRRVGFHQLADRLDRYLCSQCWKSANYIVHSDILPYFESDHFPIQLSILPSNSPLTSFSRASFKFESVWYCHPYFDALLKQWWKDAPLEPGTKMFHFHKKMQYVKWLIKIWNKHALKIFLRRKCSRRKTS